MHKKIYLPILFVFIATILSAQSIVGSWMGGLTVGGSQMRMVFNIKQNDEVYTTTFDSPDQKAFGIATSKTTVASDSINIEIKVIGGGYKGKWNGKDEIVGTFSQGMGRYNIVLKRVTGNDVPKPAEEKIRPQTPKPPFDYSVENVEYNNADSSVRFGATLTKPKGNGKFPVVVIISGSGTQDRDGSLFGHKSYWVLADYLTNNGIAVLRVDDRGAGKSTLGKNYMKLTSVDFANDVETSIHYLLNRNDIDKNNIGLIGHSEGGMIAPMVAARNKNVSFIVTLAGPGQKGEEIWKYQMRRSFVNAKVSEQYKASAEQLVNEMNDAFKHSDTLKIIEKEMTNTYHAWKQNISDSLEATMLNTKGALPFITLAKQYQSGLSWLKYFMNYDPATNLQKLKIPVLATNGENDIQVLCKENLVAIEKALKKGGNKNHTIKAFPGLNHLFQTCKSKEDSYEELDETFSPIAMSYISTWINEHLKR